jgi:hypothetical protein
MKITNIISRTDPGCCLQMNHSREAFGRTRTSTKHRVRYEAKEEIAEEAISSEA